MGLQRRGRSIDAVPSQVQGVWRPPCLGRPRTSSACVSVQGRSHSASAPFWRRVRRLSSRSITVDCQTPSELLASATLIMIPCMHILDGLDQRLCFAWPLTACLPSTPPPPNQAHSASSHCLSWTQGAESFGVVRMHGVHGSFHISHRSPVAPHARAPNLTQVDRSIPSTHRPGTSRWTADALRSALDEDALLRFSVPETFVYMSYMLGFD